MKHWHAIVGLWRWVFYIFVVAVVILEGPIVLYILGWGLSCVATGWAVGAYGERQIWNLCEFCSAIKLQISPLLWCWHSKHTSSYARIDFLPWMGWGEPEQAPWSTTSSGGDVKPIIDPGLRNQWLLYYIIIDGARKCHGQSTTYYLLCWIVSLVCVRTLCSALVFPYHVYLYYVQLAFIFLLWFQLGKWTLVYFRGCKRNKFFQTLQWVQAEYKSLDTGRWDAKEDSQKSTVVLTSFLVHLP